MRILAFLSLVPLLLGQPAFTPNPSDLARIRQGLEALRGQLASIPESDLKADVEVYAKAAEWILRYPEEFYREAYVRNALTAVEIGAKRAAELKLGKASWADRKGYVARAYRSRVDASIQPYGVVVPESYSGAPVRLDVWLHGRGGELNEVSFLADHDPEFPRIKALAERQPDPEAIQLDVFGRTNNAYRWSGETDVWEAIKNVQKRYKIDEKRIVLRGFSMGGAGAWHLGLQHPSRWAAFEAGAGFNETIKYARQTALHPVVEKLLTVYDAYRYALNAFNVPTVGYGGEEDPQLQSSVNVREQLTAEGFRFEKGPFRWTTGDLKALFLIGPATKHKWHTESKAESEAFIRSVLPQKTPEHVRFVTYTLRYPESHWIRIEGLEHHYERAEVDAEGGTIRTKNITRLAVHRAVDVEIDGQRAGKAPATFEKAEGKWRVAKRLPASGKRPGLQGPVDDAFTNSFVCVRPTGKAWSEAGNRLALERLDRFSKEYAKWLRADPAIRDDRSISESDIRNSNLILFGDPGSNRLIARVLKGLPLEWSPRRFKLGGGEYDPAANLPVLIAPNPLNPAKYIVLNSGHTFGEREFKGTNALLFPRIGDWGIVRVADGSVAETGLFDEHWR